MKVYKEHGYKAQTLLNLATRYRIVVSLNSVQYSLVREAGQVGM
jgi:hypothetical protein